MNKEKYHVLPIDDLLKHEESENCQCQPKIEVQESGDLIVIHNAFDGRDLVEQGLGDESIVINQE